VLVPVVDRARGVEADEREPEAARDGDLELGAPDRLEVAAAGRTDRPRQEAGELARTVEEQALRHRHAGRVLAPDRADATGEVERERPERLMRAAPRIDPRVLDVRAEVLIGDLDRRAEVRTVERHDRA